MHFTSSTAADGVVERDFLIDGIPCVLWSPEGGGDDRPLVLIGHGGG
jgi:hypothetical protein